MSWQPLIDAAATIVAFWLWPWMFALTWFVVLIGRSNFVRWIEALGWNGAYEMLASFGHAPMRPVAVERVDNVTTIARG